MQVGRDGRTRYCELWVMSGVWTYERGHVAHIASFTKLLFVLLCLLSFAFFRLPLVFSILYFLIPICLQLSSNLSHASSLYVFGFSSFFFFFISVFIFFFGTNLTSQNSICEEIENRLNSGNILLLFGAEYFVFQFAVQKYKH
jgi:hypothetical protein